MLESRLFGDFARELVGRKGSAVWTHGAVLGTWGWNVWMGGKGVWFFFPPSFFYDFVWDILCVDGNDGRLRYKADTFQHNSTPSQQEP